MGLPQSHPHLIDRANDLGSQVREQINVLNSSVTELTTAVKNFDGSLLDVLLQSLAIISAETKIDATTLKTAFPTTQSSNFTEEESSSIVTTLASLITPITGSITALSAKVGPIIPPLSNNIWLAGVLIYKLVFGVSEDTGGTHCVARPEGTEGAYRRSYCSFGGEGYIELDGLFEHRKEHY
jgi:hypothetical protein